VFHAFLSAKLQIIYAEEHLQPYDVLSGLTREDFIVFLCGYKEYSDISFPVVGVLPGQVLQIQRSRTTTPTVPSLGLPTGDTSPTASIDQPSPKSTNGPSASMSVPPFHLKRYSEMTLFRMGQLSASGRSILTTSVRIRIS